MMPKKKAAPKKESADVISDLLELAQELNLPEGALDCDVSDEADHEAKMVAKTVNDGSLMGQLEFLYERGMAESRLAELIREYAAGGEQ